VESDVLSFVARAINTITSIALPQPHEMVITIIIIITVETMVDMVKVQDTVAVVVEDIVGVTAVTAVVTEEVMAEAINCFSKKTRMSKGSSSNIFGSLLFEI